MLNSLTLLRAMNGIHEEDVVMAENSYYEKTVKHFKTKRIVTFALAAVLILAMSVTAYAAWKYLSARDVAYRLEDEKLTEQELAELRSLLK